MDSEPTHVFDGGAAPDWPSREVEAERAAWRFIDELAPILYDATTVISHQGGDDPFDGVLDALRRRLWTFAGYQRPQGEPSTRRKPISMRVRLAVFKRDGFECVGCGSAAVEELTIDHVVPWSKRGSDDIDNLQTLCRSCNSRKGARV